MRRAARPSGVRCSGPRSGRRSDASTATLRRRTDRPAARPRSWRETRRLGGGGGRRGQPPRLERAQPGEQLDRLLAGAKLDGVLTDADRLADAVAACQRVREPRPRLLRLTVELRRLLAGAELTAEIA